jgi:hypothetical protein
VLPPTVLTDRSADGCSAAPAVLLPLQRCPGAGHQHGSQPRPTPPHPGPPGRRPSSASSSAPPIQWSTSLTSRCRWRLASRWTRRRRRATARVGARPPAAPAACCCCARPPAATARQTESHHAPRCCRFRVGQAGARGEACPSQGDPAQPKRSPSSAQRSNPPLLPPLQVTNYHVLAATLKAMSPEAARRKPVVARVTLLGADGEQQSYTGTLVGAPPPPLPGPGPRSRQLTPCMLLLGAPRTAVPAWRRHSGSAQPRGQASPAARPGQAPNPATSPPCPHRPQARTRRATWWCCT